MIYFLSLQHPINNECVSNMASMFEQLMSLPLFCGVSHEKLSRVVGQVKMEFLKYAPLATLIHAGDCCTHLVFLLSGSIEVNMGTADGLLSVRQTITAPAVVEPDFFFGRYTDSPATVTALDDVSVLRVLKNDYLKILNIDSVFMLNYLNTLAADAQRSVHSVLNFKKIGLVEQLALWVEILTRPGSTDIVLSTATGDFSNLLNAATPTFKEELAELQRQEVLRLEDGKLRILSRDRLLHLIN